MRPLVIVFPSICLDLLSGIGHVDEPVTIETIEQLLVGELPALPKLSGGSRGGTGKAMLFGFTVGGGATACSACSNPVLPVVLGVATLQGNTWWGVILLASGFYLLYTS